MSCRYISRYTSHRGPYDPYWPLLLSSDDIHRQRWCVWRRNAGRPIESNLWAICKLVSWESKLGTIVAHHMFAYCRVDHISLIVHMFCVCSEEFLMEVVLVRSSFKHRPFSQRKLHTHQLVKRRSMVLRAVLWYSSWRYCQHKLRASFQRICTGKATMTCATPRVLQVC